MPKTIPATGPIFLPCIMGPTGAGKSAAALELARKLPIAVINADSRQLYRDFPLITAQPPASERAICPHRLYGFLPTGAKLGAGAFARAATRLIHAELQRDRLPVMVGGTGLYFKALLEGMAPIPPVPPALAAKWQQRLKDEGPKALHALLSDIDPAYASKIHPHDRQRIVRALEVHEATGRSFSWWHNRPLPPASWQALKVGIALPLGELEPLLAARIEAMLGAGAISEARTALDRCPAPDAPGWSGIGCQELRRHLEGRLSLDECRALWLKNTRAYAKRQMTWFRSDKSIIWFRPDESALAVEQIAAALF